MCAKLEYSESLLDGKTCRKEPQKLRLAWRAKREMKVSRPVVKLTAASV